MQKILIIGGTNFIGRNLIEKLIELNKYDLTVFNRGLTNPNIFPALKRITGDRNTNDVALIGKSEWDYVIDLSCYFPNSIDKITSVLNRNIKRYIFVSTCSVYDTNLEKSILRNEEAAICACTDEEAVDTLTSTYGNRKAECERRLQESKLPFTILRPSLVYGKYDPTDRFYYWLYQVKTQSEILIPNDGEQTFSITYVDDLVQCIIAAINPDATSETYNVITIPQLSISKIVASISTLLERRPTIFNAKADFLKGEQISEWMDVPLWINNNFHTYDNSKFLARHDFDLTNFEDSLEQTLSYYDELGWPVPKYGLSDQRKMELIQNIKKQARS